MLKENIIQLQTIVYREITRFARIWVQTLVPPIITTALYFIIFGNLIGRHIPAMDGYSYMQFIVPGLIMMTVINNSYVNVVSSFFSSKFQKQIEEILVSPTPNIVILIGYLSGGVLRGMIVGCIVTIVAHMFSSITILYPFFTVFIVFFTALFFSLAGFVNAVYAQKFDDISLVPTFILQPLTYLGGVFYSIALLPEFWQNISKLNPILYIINAFRFGFLGVADVDVYFATFIIILFTIILFLFALHLLATGKGLKT